LRGRTLDSVNLARRIAEVALDRKALNVVIIDVRDQASYTDFLVIASGTSDRHIQSVAELVMAELKAAGRPPSGAEGLRSGEWALVDFGDAVLHVFHQFTRQSYDLEGLWSGAPRLEAHEQAAKNLA